MAGFPPWEEAFSPEVAGAAAVGSAASERGTKGGARGLSMLNMRGRLSASDYVQADQLEP